MNLVGKAYLNGISIRDYASGPVIVECKLNE